MSLLVVADSSVTNAADGGVNWAVPVGFVAWTAAVAVCTYLVVRQMPKSEDAADEYFAGGRSLKWYVVAGSLMLTNLSSEQLVGLNGVIYADGCLTAIWWEAGASLTIMMTAAIFLPKYMQLGIITTARFLGERYDRMLRSWVAAIFVVYYSVVLCPVVLYAGAVAIRVLFDWTEEDLGVGKAVPIWWISTAIGVLGAIYAISGGLKAVAVSDCFNGIGLLVIGLAVPLVAMTKLKGGHQDLFNSEGVENLAVLTGSCPVWNDGDFTRTLKEPSIPWHVVPVGMFLNNMYYWATNQLIVQRALGAESLAQGQKGVVFAACMKVMGFAFLCMPGLIAIELEKQGFEVGGVPFKINKSDEVYPEVVKAVLPDWSKGLFLGVLLGSVLSTFNSALNSASTMFSLEIYKIFISPGADQENTVRVGGIFGILLTAVSLFVAPQLEGLDSLFNTLQLMNTIVSLPILAVFFTGIFFVLPDALACKVGFVVGALAMLALQGFNPGFYGAFGLVVPSYATLHFLHVFELAFAIAMALIATFTLVPRARAILGGSERPTPYEVRLGLAKVDMTPWAPLPMVIIVLCLVLTLLMFVLQTGNLIGFYVFWVVWILASVALILAPVPAAEKPEGAEESEGGFISTILSLRTNSIDRGSVLKSNVEMT